MTANVLQLANSGIFGAKQNVVCAEEAVEMIGLGNLKTLFQANNFPSQAKTKAVRNFVSQVADHSWETATLAREIALAESLSPKIVKECFTGAILHDIGKLVLAESWSTKYPPLVASVDSSKQSLKVIEENRFGIGHDQVAGSLLMLWGLPDVLVNTVSLHYSPDTIDFQNLDSAGIVFAANAILAQRSRPGGIGAHSPIPGLQKELLQHVNRWQDLLPRAVQPSG